MSHSRQDSSMKKRKETESNVSHFFFFFSLSSLPEKLQIQDSGVVKKCTNHSIPFMTLDYSSEMQKFYRFFFFSRLYEVCYYNTLGKTGYNKLQFSLTKTMLLYVFAATFACCAKYRNAVKFGYKRGFNYVDKARSPIRNDFPFPCADKTNFHEEECIDHCIFRLSRSLKMFQPLKWKEEDKAEYFHLFYISTVR